MANAGKRVGDLFEKEVEKANDIYNSLGVSLIQKIPTPTTVIRGKGGKIVNAFHSGKSTLDYMGLFNKAPITFDAKHSKGSRFPLGNIHEHQYEFMKSWEKHGGISFLLIGMSDHEEFFVLPLKDLIFFWERRENNIVNGKAKNGTASISIEELREKAISVNKDKGEGISKKEFINYKRAVEKIIEERL